MEITSFKDDEEKEKFFHDMRGIIVSLERFSYVYSDELDKKAIGYLEKIIEATKTNFKKLGIEKV